MLKQTAQKPLKNFLPQLEALVKGNLVLIYSVIVGLSLANLAAAFNLLTFNLQTDFVSQTQAVSTLPTLRILTPKPEDKVSAEVPIVLAFDDNSQGFASLTLLVDGRLEREVKARGETNLSLTLNTKKFKNSAHKLTFKATDTKDRTQTLELDLNFSNPKRR